MPKRKLGSSASRQNKSGKICGSEEECASASLESPPTEICPAESGDPLLNPVVLTRLFELCPLSDLPRFRLVSKQWYSLSLTRFRKEMTVAIYHPQAIKLRRKFARFKITRKGMADSTTKGTDWNELGNKLDVGEKPFRTFRLHYMKFDNLSKWQDEASLLQDPKQATMYRSMGVFFSKYGSSIRRLEICGAEVHSVEELKKAIFEETPNLENLTLTELNLKEVISVERNLAEAQEAAGGQVIIQSNLKHLILTGLGQFPISWTDIFHRFPNIQKLEINLANADMDLKEDILLQLTSISQQLNVKSKRNVKFILSMSALRADSATTRAAIRVVQLPRLTIQEMSIRPNESEVGRASDEQLRELISTTFRHHGSTLQELELHVHHATSLSSSNDFPFQADTFTSLTSLSLSGKCSQNLHFLEQFPNLKILSFSEGEKNILQETDSTRMGRIKLEQVRVLHFFQQSYTIPENVVKMFVEMMNNVEDFKGGVSDSTLTIICGGWKKLKELEIASGFKDDEGRITDEGITGIVVGRDERLPNITDLKDLESLTISRPERVATSSIYNGFLKLPQLKTLRVQLSFETNEDAFQALIKRFPGVRMNRNIE